MFTHSFVAEKSRTPHKRQLTTAVNGIAVRATASAIRSARVELQFTKTIQVRGFFFLLRHLLRVSLDEQLTGRKEPSDRWTFETYGTAVGTTADILVRGLAAETSLDVAERTRRAAEVVVAPMTK